MLLKFHVLSSEEDQNLEGIDYPVLLNQDHIASVKKINIMFKGNIINGFWIRMVNGKKYKATRIPTEIEDLFQEDDGHTTEIKINGQEFLNSEEGSASYQ